jgi:gamma-glutamylaminecyclotransferase
MLSRRVGIMQRDGRLFVYGTLRQGEPRHALLAAGTALGAATTLPAFHLVDVGPYAALVRGGATAVHGELYSVDAQVRRAIDVALEVPILFTREVIELAEGGDADTYLLSLDQVRGRRRLAHGDWKQRFARNVPSLAGGAWVQWARGRWKK